MTRCRSCVRRLRHMDPARYPNHWMAVLGRVVAHAFTHQDSILSACGLISKAPPHLNRVAFQ